MKHIFLIICFITSCVHAQEVVYYKENRKVTSKDSAFYYRQAAKQDSGYVASFFYMDGSKMSVLHYKSLDPEIKQGDATWYLKTGQISETAKYSNNKMSGPHIYYYENGLIHVKENYKDGVFDDTLTTYYNDGAFKRFEVWNNGNFLNGKVITKSKTDTVFYRYEEQAEFPGGVTEMMKFISKNTHYPKKARRKGIQGKVFLKFLITETGRVEGISILKSADPMLEEPAIAVIKEMPDWIPARMDGVPVKCYFNLPLSFKISD